RLFGWEVQHCLSETVEEVCKLQFHIGILFGVIAMNLVKVLVMLSVLLFYNTDELLVTIGDAISSFLELPDSNTCHCSLLSRRDVDEGDWRSELSRGRHNNSDIEVRRCQSRFWEGRKEKRIFSSCPKRLWLLCYTL